MTRNLRKFGLALFAILAMSSISAAAAQAVVEFRPEIKNEFLHGEQNAAHVLVVNARNVKCEKATVVGELAGPSVEMTLAPTYAECTAFGLAAEVKMNGCEYRFKVNNAAAPFEGPISIECPAGKVIEINAGGGVCLVTVAAQNPAKKVGYANKGAGAARDFDIEAVNVVLEVSVTGPVLVCGANGAKAAQYSGSLTLKGNEAANTAKAQVGLWIE
jgi:hypothetical protein